MLGGSRDFEKERAIGKVKMLARDYGVGFDKTRTIISDVDLQREFETDGRGRITLGPEFADSEVYVTIKKRDESGEELPEELQGLTA